MKESFLLALRALARGKALWLMLGAIALAHAILPGLARSDGSVESETAMVIKIAFGAPFAIVLLGTLVAAAGVFPLERESKRLQLTLVRPVGTFRLALGRWLALVVFAATALSFSSILVLVRPGLDCGRSRIVSRPALESAQAVAERMIDDYLKSPDTPEVLKKMSRERVLSHLAALENERRLVLSPGASVVLPFDAGLDDAEAVQLKFMNIYGLYMDFRGKVDFAGRSAVFTNTTQRVLEVPLSSEIDGKDAKGAAGEGLEVWNLGDEPFVLRPRRDISLLTDGGPFALNLLLATIVAISMAAALAALGLSLGSALSRPVAVFAAVVILLASLMTPGIVASQPDRAKDLGAVKLGMAISRGIASTTGRLLSPAPTEALSQRMLIPAVDVCATVCVSLVLFPLAMVFLSSLALRSSSRSQL